MKTVYVVSLIVASILFLYFTKNKSPEYTALDLVKRELEESLTSLYVELQKKHAGAPTDDDAYRLDLEEYWDMYDITPRSDKIHEDHGIVVMTLAKDEILNPETDLTKHKYTWIPCAPDRNPRLCRNLAR